MSKRTSIQRILSMGLTWGALWLGVMMCIFAAIGIADPDSIDPGEPLMFFLVFGPMAFLSGVAFATLLSFRERGKTALDLSLGKTILWGILGSAIVQLGFLNHGDLGLAANIPLALALSVFGGMVTAAWLLLARRCSQWHSLHSSGSR